MLRCLLILVSSLTFYVGCGIQYPPEYTLKEIHYAGYLLLVQYRDPAIYGPHHMIVREKGRNPEVIFTTQIYNDGAVLSEDNVIVVERNDRHLTLRFRGSDQMDECWKISPFQGQHDLYWIVENIDHYCP